MSTCHINSSKDTSLHVVPPNVGLIPADRLFSRLYSIWELMCLDADAGGESREGRYALAELMREVRETFPEDT